MFIASYPLLPYLYKLIKKPEAREEARAAWAKKYSTPFVTLKSGDDRPFILGRGLGEGGFGEVYETKLGGTVVALKRTRIPRGRLRPQHTAEIELLEEMSHNRHRHIIELIGAYILPGIQTEVGLLLWPIAQYDLARLLAQLEAMNDLINHPDETSPPREDQKDALMELRAFTELPVLNTDELSPRYWYQLVRETHLRALLRLQCSIGCIAQAVNYLHNEQKIRHKDLKPSQVLVSANGLWLTDFGWSLDISKEDNSVTSNGDRITLKYHAPERHAMEPCGRSEDIFGLGCIFLEVGIVVCKKTRELIWNPNKEQGWSYQANLDNKDRWLNHLRDHPTGIRFGQMKALIGSMLERNPGQRPSMSQVTRILKRLERESTGAFQTRVESQGGTFFDRCCTPSLMGHEGS